MKIENISCMLMKSESFDFSGKTYYSARFLVNGEVFKVSVSTEVYATIEDVVEKKGVANFAVSCRSEKVKLSLVSFK